MIVFFKPQGGTEIHVCLIILDPTVGIWVGFRLGPEAAWAMFGMSSNYRGVAYQQFL